MNQRKRVVFAMDRFFARPYINKLSERYEVEHTETAQGLLEACQKLAPDIVICNGHISTGIPDCASTYGGGGDLAYKMFREQTTRGSKPIPFIFMGNLSLVADNSIKRMIWKDPDCTVILPEMTLPNTMLTLVNRLTA